MRVSMGQQRTPAKMTEEIACYLSGSDLAGYPYYLLFTEQMRQKGVQAVFQLCWLYDRRCQGRMTILFHMGRRTYGAGKPLKCEKPR